MVWLIMRALDFLSSLFTFRCETYFFDICFVDNAVCHILKNYIGYLLNAKVPLILGIWGGKGQGKTFTPVSAGVLESERAGKMVFTYSCY
ncbi:Hypothetical predicted protein [Olea europaea subsp. europaea]|uniref:Uncharacterized protein n=1 Tax=Olea europaea subsp. europaea TaxID=158383 RepID=A0A8S0RQV1_OLEEU|nr:Hypothetical predicted protein [Olea europaea subsp. europaea]